MGGLVAVGANAFPVEYLPCDIDLSALRAGVTRSELAAVACRADVDVKLSVLFDMLVLVTKFASSEAHGGRPAGTLHHDGRNGAARV